MKLRGAWEEKELYYLSVHFLCKVDPKFLSPTHTRRRVPSRPPGSAVGSVTQPLQASVSS